MAKVLRKDFDERIIILDDGTNIDMDDFYSGYKVCRQCGEVFRSDDARVTDYGISCERYYICDDCITNEGDLIRTCDSCGSLVYRDYTVTACDSENCYCDDCRDDHLGVCDNCGDWFENLQEDDNGNYLCRRCMRRSRSRRVISGYHNMKNSGDYSFRFSKDENPSDLLLYEGVELEVANGNTYKEDMAARVIDMFTMGGTQIIYAENDGSLYREESNPHPNRENSFEMITQPCTLRWHLEHRKMYEKLFKELTDNGYRSHDTVCCGLHVHCSVSFFGGRGTSSRDRAITRLLFIFNKFWNEIVTFARRKPEEVAKWADKYYSPIPTIIKAYNDGWLNDNHEERYHAVNLTNNKTIEFRIAKGTLNINTFFATLKFYDRICRLATHTPVSKIDKMTFEELLGDDEEVKNYWQSRVNKMTQGDVAVVNENERPADFYAPNITDDEFIIEEEDLEF